MANSVRATFIFHVHVGGGQSFLKPYRRRTRTYHSPNPLTNSTFDQYMKEIPDPSTYPVTPGPQLESQRRTLAIAEWEMCWLALREEEVLRL
ncbi:hypothetical protein HYFRA_00001557 [Hymenoscyphus fraxineus]|uniref:Uncharacterized protein n=1 Tax=Hymenoscyphus fraxineus TaxID=746836 RepID=A0A9N9L543_9HELO|nr:hypothetical protein HYFRA_00001557 [Hymenoscyphus fraxineus]